VKVWLLALLLAPVQALAQAAYGEREDVQTFIRSLVERHGFVEDELGYLFARVRRADPVIEAIQRPAEKIKPWPAYRATFLDERRVAAGAAFWRSHRKTLERAERAYGVPAQVIVAIIGVETFYGRHTGRWRVVDALSTLAFDYPPRSGFFRSELESYLLFARDRGVDVFSMRGSYAGAMGMPQFMPSSARRYGVDFDRDGHVDLRRPSDAIGSVGNFLKQHGWRRGGEVLLPARVSGEAWRGHLDDGLSSPRRPLGEWLRLGVEPAKAPADEAEPATLVELGGSEVPSEYRLGFRNFYVLTRYNRSAFYAAAVSDLAQALQARVSPPRVPPQRAGK
jgi:membrane-bound lytic murein transglycosylase B